MGFQQSFQLLHYLILHWSHKLKHHKCNSTPWAGQWDEEWVLEWAGEWEEESAAMLGNRLALDLAIESESQ
jgi:hypothetical protein